jgi:hypothetical protein
MPEVVELSNNFSALLFELPDPDEQLFCQSPHTFWLFSKLPLEIRLNIWRQTFPRRTHMIFNGPYKPWPCLRVRHTPLPPVSSRVNFESRQETLRHYKFFQTSPGCICYSLRRHSTFAQRGTFSEVGTFISKWAIIWKGIGISTSRTASRSSRLLSDSWK